MGIGGEEGFRFFQIGIIRVGGFLNVVNEDG